MGRLRRALVRRVSQAMARFRREVRANSHWGRPPNQRAPKVYGQWAMQALQLVPEDTQ